MTTIVYRNGILAGDRRVSIDKLVLPETVRKVHRLRDGRLFAWSGEWSLYEAVLAHFKNPQLECPPIREKGQAIVVMPDGKVFTFEANVLMPVGGPYVARGSGMDFAYGALAAGASATEAVRIAASLDASTGGGVDVVQLRKLRKPC